MRQVIAEGEVHGRRFARLYLTDASQRDLAVQSTEDNDYVFVYSLVALGDMNGFSYEEKATQLIELKGTEDEIFAGLNSNNRYKVRRSYRDENVEVRVDDPERDASVSFYTQVKTADDVRPDIVEDFSSVRWINAYHEGRLASSTCWFDSSEVLRAKHIVSLRKEDGVDTGLVGRLTRRLFWEACALGIQEGHHFVDLGGVDTSESAKSGVAEFKTSFGGRLAPVFVYRYTGPNWADVATKVAEDGRTIV